MAEELVTLTSFMYATDAHMFVAKLDGDGIQSFLDDENLISAQPFLSNAIGGIKVKVRPEDHKNALAIFKKYEEDKKILDAEQEMKLGKDYKKVYEFCPQCESSEVYRKKGFWPGAHEHVCADCKFTWKK